MLLDLQIKNLALIENLSLNFKAGFSSLTGETGAGKSILLDGLGLALGERSDASLVRHGEERAEVSASFAIDKIPAAQNWLAENSLDEDGLCLLRRIVNAQGTSRAYINGRQVPAGNLKELGSLLIDIHGQHEHQSLLSLNNQMDLVDAYGHHEKQLTKVQASYKDWQTQYKYLEDLRNNQAEHQSKLELLEFQLSEFEKLQIQANEFSELASEQSTLAHANDIKRFGFAAYQALEGENDMQGAIGLIADAIAQLEKLAEFSPELNSQLEQLQSNLIDLQESAGDIYQFAESVDLDPARLQQVDERLGALHALAKKYQLDADNLAQKHQELLAEHQKLKQDFGSLDELETKLNQAWLQLNEDAKALTKLRLASSEKLAKTVTATMQTLGMEKGVFSIEISPLEKPNAKGIDRIEFMVAANPGQPAKPLAKVASGGELSRISLAIQVASAEVAQIPTLIFDEVDVGIGGGIAEVVGQKMRELGQKRQVLSITHLGQVAAFGNQHLAIAKQTKNNQTSTKVVELNETERVEEIARMIGGLEITEPTRQHAKELLTRGQA